MSTEKDQFSPFKFRDIRCYASPEWLVDRKKKYRQVFQESLLSFLYVELTLYNKRFDVEDWELKVNFKCHEVGFDGQFLRELGSIEVTEIVPPSEHIVYVHQGWGAPELGSYWRHGTYTWIAHVDGVAVGSIMFYVQSEGVVTPDHNPYFSIQSLRLFEGPMDLPLATARNYASNFQPASTRYVWAELTIENLFQNRDWMCELTFLFYNDSRELKGHNVRLEILRPSSRTLDICGGWGNDVAGTWYDGGMTLEIVFMDQLIAVLPFEIGMTSHRRTTKPSWLDGLKPKNWLFGKK